jgi:hypothetical protein
MPVTVSTTPNEKKTSPNKIKNFPNWSETGKREIFLFAAAAAANLHVFERGFPYAEPFGFYSVKITALWGFSELTLRFPFLVGVAAIRRNSD